MHLFDSFIDDVTWLADSSMTLQLNEGLVGVDKASCKDSRHVAENRFVLEKIGVGDVKLRGFQSAHIGCVWGIQQCGHFAEHCAGLSHLSDFDTFFDYRDSALLKIKSRPVFDPAASTVSLGRKVARGSAATLF